jgi:SAM-dependent methyltransferase
LNEYPIPELRLPGGNEKLFLEIGCNWGRWSIAAARLGYRCVGIDPSLKAIRAARGVARQIGIDAYYVVADGRYLPFGNQVFDQAFSYSVLQHLSKENVLITLREVRRVLAPEGQSLVQMPNVFGIRCMYHQARRHFREPRDFEVRYWTPKELTSVFNTAIGPSQLFVDGYFSLNAQIRDVRFMPPRYRALLRASEFLRSLSKAVPPLAWMADSLYVKSSPQPWSSAPRKS